MEDGGEVGLDWLHNSCRPNDPIVLFLPGLTGSSQTDYMRALVSAASEETVRCVVFNNRGLGGTSLKVEIKIDFNMHSFRIF